MTASYRTIVHTTDDQHFLGDPIKRSMVAYNDYLDALADTLGSEVGWVRLVIDQAVTIIPVRHIHHVDVRTVE